MKVTVLPCCRATFLMMYLNHMQLVGHLEQRRRTHVDLRLAAGGHLVVLALDLDADRLHDPAHLGAEVLLAVGGADREVALLVARLVAEVPALLLAAGVPLTFDRVDLVERVVHAGVVADVVEDEELGLGAPLRNQ